VSRNIEQRIQEKISLSKEEVLNSTERAIANSREQQQQQQAPVETVVREQPKIGRNQRVTIKNVMTGEEKEVKFKQAIPLLQKGEWVLK
jgi:preprotein translocase subunit SecA